MPYFGYKCTSCEKTFVKVQGFNRSQLKETYKAGRFQFDETLPWVAREEECEFCGQVAKELTAEEAHNLGVLRQEPTPFYLNWVGNE